MTAPNGDAGPGIATPPDTVVSEIAETSSAEESSAQEHTLSIEGSPTVPSEGPRENEDDRDQNNKSEAKDANHVNDRAVETPVDSTQLSAEPEPVTTDAHEDLPREDVPDDVKGAAVDTKEEKNEQAKETKSNIVSRPPSVKPLPSAVPKNEVECTFLPTSNVSTCHEARPKASPETAAPSKPAQSVPPHLRPGFEPPTFPPPESANTRHVSPPNKNGSANARGVPSAQVARLNAQLLKVNSDLASERTKNAQLRQLIESEQRQNIDAAFSAMLTSLLDEQAAALALKAKVEAHERDLELRERKIAQYEVFLSQGQKHLSGKLNARSMNAAQLEHMRREAELDMRKSLADKEAELAVKSEELRLRIAAHEKREQQSKVLMREELEAELTENMVSVDKADEMAQAEYDRGFERGVEAGRKDGGSEANKRAFLEGYQACYRVQAALSKFRKGEIPYDSPELDAVFDPAHEHHIFSIGIQIGKLDLQGAAAFSDSGVEVKKDAVREESEYGSEDRSAYDSYVEDTPQRPVTVRSSPSPPPHLQGRPTLAAELRGYTPMYKGCVILANADAALAKAAKRAERSAPPVKHEGPDLIDLS